ncbi:MAG: hypothetical protein MJ032_02100, partial [Acidaminococcaceae bacterium]|nr:hypothetical protein [Acidaminococcaceae bacterium]
VTLEDGHDYYFRVGAHTSASEAKWNYAEAVKIHITKKELPKKELGIRWDLFDHFEYWDKHRKAMFPRGGATLSRLVSTSICSFPFLRT